MNIIDERDVRTIHRKIRKKEYDEMINLSVSDNGQWVRLLDEGMVVYGDGSPWFYLMKGTLRKFYDELSEDYEGSVNIGHTDLASFPERIVGKWTKADLRLVSIGDGREALDVYLRLNEEHPLVKALRMAEFDLGVSAEFYAHRNEEYSEQYGLEIVDGVTITDFAIVGDAGNVNSMGIQLKGANKMIDLKELASALENEGKSPDIEKVNELLGKALEATDAPAEETEEAIEEPEEVEEAEEAEEVAEEAEAPEEPEEAEAEEEPEEEAEEEPEEEVSLNAYTEAIEKLSNALEALQKENEDLKSKLSAKAKAEKEFVEKFKNLSVSLTSERKPEHKQSVDYSDGIGEL